MARKRRGSRLTDIIILISLSLVILFAVSALKRGKPGAEKTEITPSTVTVEVLNGCGEAGVAGQIRRVLQDQGFDVVLVDNAEEFDYPITLVKDRKGDWESARRVGEALGIIDVIQAVDPTRLLQVTVIVGRDYRRILFPRKKSWFAEVRAFIDKKLGI